MDTEKPTVFDAICEGSPGVRRASPDTTSLSVRRIRQDELQLLGELNKSVFDIETAHESDLVAVFHHNPDCLWAIVERDFDGVERLAGYYAFLLLNAEGHDRLLDRSFDRRHPSLSLLAKAGEKPDAHYTWGIVAPKLRARARPLVSQELVKQGLYVGIPRYATAGTEGGLKVLRGNGSHPLTPEDDRLDGLFANDGHVANRDALLLRQQEAARRFRSRRNHSQNCEVVVVSNAAQLMQVHAIRAAVFAGEQRCPLDEEFDNNDFTCTHFLGLVDGEPAATMRLRYFGDGVKLERIALLPKYRRVTSMARDIAIFVIDFARRKGFRAAYGTAQVRFSSFWQQLGFEILPERDAPIVYSDHEYVEIFREFEPHPEAIGLRSDPYVLMRPEGRWDVRSALDRSAARPATNPH